MSHHPVGSRTPPYPPREVSLEEPVDVVVVVRVKVTGRESPTYDLKKSPFLKSTRIIPRFRGYAALQSTDRSGRHSIVSHSKTVSQVHMLV